MLIPADVEEHLVFEKIYDFLFKKDFPWSVEHHAFGAVILIMFGLGDTSLPVHKISNISAFSFSYSFCNFFCNRRFHNRLFGYSSLCLTHDY